MFWSVQESSIDGEEHCLNDEQGVADEPGDAESDKLEGHGIRLLFLILLLYILQIHCVYILIYYLVIFSFLINSSIYSNLIYILYKYRH